MSSCIDWYRTGIVLEALCFESHRVAREKGFYDQGERNVGECLALLHSEVSEALEEWRNGAPLTAMRMGEDSYGGHKPEGFGVELADVLIRLFDLACAKGVNLTECLKMKMAYNETRPPRHGGKLA